MCPHSIDRIPNTDIAFGQSVYRLGEQERLAAITVRQKKYHVCSDVKVFQRFDNRDGGALPYIQKTHQEHLCQITRKNFLSSIHPAGGCVRVRGSRLCVMRE